MSNRSQALSQLKKAREIIEAGENRAMAADGSVGHCREELTNQEFDEMWKHVDNALKLLTPPSHKRRSLFNIGNPERLTVKKP